MAKTGKNYTTQTGLPVKVIAINSDNILIQSLATDNRLCVPLHYPLSSFNRKKPISKLKDKPYALPSERIKPKKLKQKTIICSNRRITIVR